MKHFTIAGIAAIAAITTLAIALAGSLILNVVLFRQADGDYREVNAVRLDPSGLAVHANSTPPPLQPGQSRLVLFGDSRAQDWPAPGSGASQVINRGVGAQTSAQILGRVRADVLGIEPDVVLVQACINDLKTIGLWPHTEDEVVSSCLQNLRRTVDAVRERGAAVILTTVIPSTGNPPLARRMYWSPRIDAAVGRVNAELRGWAGDGIRVLDAAALVSDERGLLRPEYATDLLHLNAAGYDALNGELERVLAQSDR